MYRLLNQRSHRIFRRYAASLPTSLGCINSTNQRLLAEETCCGDATRRGISCARRHTGATGSSVGFLNTTIWWRRDDDDDETTTTTTTTPVNQYNGGPRREAESGSDLLGRHSCSSTAHRSTNASIPSRGKENSSGATTTRPLLISREARRRSTTPSGNRRDGMLRAVFLFTSPTQ